MVIGSGSPVAHCLLCTVPSLLSVMQIEKNCYKGWSAKTEKEKKLDSREKTLGGDWVDGGANHKGGECGV